MGRTSRKNKSSWRKNIDVSDVDQFMEEQREDERVRDGAILDTQLFMEDDNKLNLKQSRKKKFQASPKFCTSLKNPSQIVVPVAKLNVKKPVPASKHSKRIKNVQLKTNKTDIWETSDLAEKKKKSLNDAVNQHTGARTEKQQLNKKQTVIPNVEIPKPGTSYNPALDDYNELRMSVVKKEKEIHKRKEHFDRVITNKFTKMSKQDRDDLVWNEMAEGLLENKDNQDTSDDERTDEEYKAVNPPVENKKKNRKAKNKKQRTIQKRNTEVTVKEELKKYTDIEKIATLKSDLNKREALTKKKQENRAKRVKDKLSNPPRVSYLKFEESEADFAEPTELTGSLRTICANRSLIVDRFKSCQKRALIAPKKHRDGILRSNKSRLKRWKRYTKGDHKDNE
ncbi:ribosome biogenesis protein NOP53-like [Sabethes cyaneus]|uniref:ribosome biogenesis protein NOP53-like n=1 Tax=Sabethes cyaneus TaxID=53552 RepID=UPI00237D6EBC|nr:ribosome biogenesis protein NOP53-like [Sabethes cyaneus]